MKVEQFIRQNPLFYAFFFPALMDGVLTLLGQDRSYWLNPSLVKEASPAFFILAISPWLFVLGGVVWFIAWYWLFLRLGKQLKLFLMFVFIAGHSWGSSSWLWKIFYEKGIYKAGDQISIITAWTLMIFYFAIISLLATYCLKIFIKKEKRV